MSCWPAGVAQYLLTAKGGAQTSTACAQHFMLSQNFAGCSQLLLQAHMTSCASYAALQNFARHLAEPHHLRSPSGAGGLVVY